MSVRKKLAKETEEGQPKEQNRNKKSGISTR